MNREQKSNHILLHSSRAGAQLCCTCYEPPRETGDKIDWPKPFCWAKMACFDFSWDFSRIICSLCYPLVHSTSKSPVLLSYSRSFFKKFSSLQRLFEYLLRTLGSSFFFFFFKNWRTASSSSLEKSESKNH